MLMVPASKVLVPPTVVMRSWVRVSERVTEPAPNNVTGALLRAIVCEEIQSLLSMRDKSMCPS